MKKSAPLLVVLACLFFATFTHASGISEAQVQELIAQVDAAIEQKSAEGVAAAMSDNVKIRINIHVRGGTQSLHPSKQKYVDMLNQAWALTSSYAYTREKQQITLSGDRATVTANVIEIATVQGQEVKTITRETAIIALVNGIPRIVEIVGDTRI